MSDFSSKVHLTLTLPKGVDVSQVASTQSSKTVLRNYYHAFESLHHGGRSGSRT